MKPLPEIFVQRFNDAARLWIDNKPNLTKGLINRNGFIEMNHDEYIQVKLNYLSKTYFEKHLNPDPDSYCDQFVSEIRPALSNLLKELKMENHIYIFLFSSHNFRATRFVHVGKA